MSNRFKLFVYLSVEYHRVQLESILKIIYRMTLQVVVFTALKYLSNFDCDN